MCQGRREDLYAVLNVACTSSIGDIKKAYRHAALHAHPDKGGNSARFHLVAHAFEVLSCPESRRIYDSFRKSSFCPTGESLGYFPWASGNGANSQQPVSSAPIKKKKDNVRKRKAAQAPAEWKQSLRKRFTSKQKVINAVNAALEELRAILQSLGAPERELAIKGMAPCVRAALLNFMEKRAKLRAALVHFPNPRATARARETGSSIEKQDAKFRRKTAPISTVACTSVRSIRRMHGTKFTAYLHIKALRLYTAAQSSFEAAVEHQMILAELQQAMRSASVNNQKLWEEPADMYKVCVRVLERSRTSEDRLGLRAFVHMRASQWLGNKCFIISPVMNLANGLHTHSRLLTAGKTSWDALRAEWARALQVRTSANHNGMPVTEVLLAADKARQTKVVLRLSHAVRRVQLALEKEMRLARRSAKAKMHQERFAARQRAKAQIREAAMRRKQQADRLKWLRADLTMEQFAHGLPPHLRSANNVDT